MIVSVGLSACGADPPHFTCRPRPIYQRQTIQSVTMPCCAEGDPTPLITWRKVTIAAAAAAADDDDDDAG